MLYHHGNRSYEEAASDAASRARIKMQQTIDEGRLSAAMTVKKVMDEVPTDHIVKARALNFTTDDECRTMMVNMGDQQLAIANHAVGQMCQRADIPVAMYRKLIDNPSTEGWGPGLMSEIFNKFYGNQNDVSYLARSYGGRLRGWLSTSYRRLDSRPLLDAFLGVTKELGMIPIRGLASETKVMMKCLMPVVFEPAPNEVVSFGATWENSDYGNGKHSLRVFVLRLWCTNFAISDEGLQQIHLGKKLSEDIQYSQRTYELDTQTSASAIRDIVRGSLEPDRIGAMCAAIEEAANTEIKNPAAFLERMKSALTKGERELIAAKYNTPDVELLPPGNTAWRMSNAISLFAQEIEDADRQIELLKLAGTVVPNLKAA
jgi:hypothetical protein